MKAINIDRGDLAGTATRVATKPVTSVMSSPVSCVGATATLEVALRILVCRGLRHLAVVDAGGRCVGVLADRMVAAAWALDPGCLSHQLVAAVLDTEPATVHTGARVLDVARLMHERGTDAVVVVGASGTAAGIVTGSDLISLLAR